MLKSIGCEILALLFLVLVLHLFLHVLDLLFLFVDIDSFSESMIGISGFLTLMLVTFSLIFVLFLLKLFLCIASQSQDPHTLLFNSVLNVSMLLDQQELSHCVLNNEFADDRKHFILVDKGAVNINGRFFI